MEPELLLPSKMELFLLCCFVKVIKFIFSPFFSFRNWFPPRLEAETPRLTANQRAPRVTTRLTPAFSWLLIPVQHSRRRVKFWTSALLQTRRSTRGTDSSAEWWRTAMACFLLLLSCSFRCSPEDTDMESGADSTTHCIQSEGRSSSHIHVQ